MVFVVVFVVVLLVKLLLVELLSVRWWFSKCCVILAIVEVLWRFVGVGMTIREFFPLSGETDKLMGDVEVELFIVGNSVLGFSAAFSVNCKNSRFNSS